MTFRRATLPRFPTTLGESSIISSDSTNAHSHYIENTSDTEDLVWIEVYKSDRVADISLTQWLALTPPEIVAQTLNVSLSFVEGLQKEKQVLIA